MTFPLGYPATHTPTFQVSSTSGSPVEMDSEKLLHIEEKLNSIARASLRGGKKTVQACLRYLVMLIHQRKTLQQKKAEKEHGEVLYAFVTALSGYSGFEFKSCFDFLGGGRGRFCFPP